MPLYFNFFNVLILAGCVQGFILAILILVKDHRSKSNLFLSFLLIAYSLNNLNAVFFDTGLSSNVPGLLILPFSLILAIGPSLYLHTRYTIHPSERFSKRNYWHFLPVAIEFLWYAALSVRFWNQPGAVLSFYHRYERFYSLPEQLLGILSVGFYLFGTLKLLRKHRLRLEDTHSAIEGLVHRRLQELVILLGLGWGIWVVLIFTDAVFFGFSLAQSVYYTLYLVMSVTVYAIGYAGYFEKLQPGSVAGGVPPSSNIPVTSAALTTWSSHPEPAQKPGMTDPFLEEIVRRAEIVMLEKKLYLETDLRLKQVADALQIPAAKLSTALKSNLKKNFYDFVNEYRVKEVCQRLGNPRFNGLTLTALAFDCGFNSKSTFNEIFKKHNGKTPKAYKMEAQKDVRIINPDVSHAG